MVVSDEVFAGRISGKVIKITDLTTAYRNLPDPNNPEVWNPFSVFLWPVDDTVKAGLITCTTVRGGTESATPFTTFCWDATLLKEISADGIDLEAFDVYVGPAL